MENVTFFPASGIEIPAIRNILMENNLPYVDIDCHINNFILARHENTLIGCIGLEVCSEYGLLRSLAVISPYRNKGIASELYNKMIARARQINVKELYLLTTTAEHFFHRLGFSQTDRKSVPEDLSKTREFTSLCPATAICMTFAL
jgi:amino-acid N-acetyltransferase